MKNKNTGARSTIIAAATLASLQLINAQEPVPTTAKTKGEQAAAARINAKAITQVTIVGVANGETVYRGSKGELFTLDPMTGDKTVFNATTKSFDAYMKIKDIPGEIIGKDGSGRVIYKDPKGQKFTLNPKTGDKVLAK
jgi:hypothetical protein